MERSNIKNSKMRLDENSKVLEKYEEKLGLPKNNPPGDTEEIEQYCLMGRDVIEKLSPGRTWSISVRLSQYSYYIGRCINRNKAIITWCESEINKIAAREIDQYDKFKRHEIKIHQICKENTAAAEILNIKKYAEQMVNRLSGVSENLKSLSYVLSMGFKHKVESGG